jgi:hypothetical protein
MRLKSLQYKHFEPVWLWEYRVRINLARGLVQTKSRCRRGCGPGQSCNIARHEFSGLDDPGDAALFKCNAPRALALDFAW